ncbi:Uncharacterized protein TPAR_01866 [Tolypocladium paradoxum]|uniref:Ubiquitin interaction domain-containing protein n=1 Tax=Tolypocladium paradoxum TaxID=94208 RepID=A0A2S4L661_9HYPO|nr:Uncharacterized protein TPAR_01866 [Tolypocladium paradoxum]
MASKEPSEEEIMQVIDFASLDPHNDRSMVIQALKNNSGSVETVVMQYFDNPASFRQKFTQVWNESMFSADRDGSDNHTGISFHIESMGQNDVIQGVTPPPEGYGPGAPSRPPSRSNDRSPLGRMVEWTAGGDIAGCSNTHSREDEDMQRALRESAQEAGVALPQQESGLVDSSTAMPHFGPANRSDYDQGNWAMVPAGTQVASASAPETRKRIPGAPAFLIQGLSTSGDHRLGGLVTILHEIPLARNILLQLGTPAASYGFNSEWWKGQEILPPQTLARLQSGEIQWGERHDASPDCEGEIHRLMAFLDSTERSHGAVSVLADLIPFSSMGPEKQFYENLAQQGSELVKPLSQVATLAHVFGDDLGDEEAKFGLLEIEHLRNDYANFQTLYECLDHVMWSDVLSWSEMHGESKMAMFKEMGEVLTIKIGGDGPEDSIEIPEEFYPERYLVSRKDEARRIQRGWCETKKNIERIAQQERMLYEWRNDLNQQSHDKDQVIHKVISQWRVYREYLEGRGRFRGMQESGFDTDQFPDYRAAPCKMNDEELHHYRTTESVLLLSQKMLDDMELRLKALSTLLEQVRAKQRFLGRLLTVPDKPGRPKPMTCKKYLLRGVATRADVVYVCQGSVPDLIELDDESKPLDQWWRLAYMSKDEQPVKAERIEKERVFRDVWLETKTPLLVYATEEALSVPRAPLSAALERFVRAENKAFRQELNRHKAEASEPKRTAMVDVMSHSKRKHRADSIDSMDSNRASIGSDDRNAFDNPFEDGQELAAMEMADMSEHGLEVIEGVDMGSAPEEPNMPRPVLPSQQPAHTENTSATLTPNTLPADDGEPTTPVHGRQPTTAGVSEDSEDRAPEMQERSRPPAFVATLQGSNREDDQTSGIDMEMPDRHE